MYPTPVQMQAIPCIMTGRDAIAPAETVSFYACIHVYIHLLWQVFF